MSDPPPQSPDAGWYPDPADPGSQRYWDGSSWTEHSAPRAPQASPQRESNLLMIVGYVGAVLLPIVGIVIGVVLLFRRNTGHGLAILALSIVVGVGSYIYVVNTEDDEPSDRETRLEQCLENDIQPDRVCLDVGRSR